MNTNKLSQIFHCLTCSFAVNYEAEYLQNGRATDKGDVYSYGVVLLELLSGKRPSDTTLVTKGLNLVQWAHQCVAESKQSDLFDPKCSQGVPKEQLESVLQVACMCINPVFDERPTMDKVVQLLEADTISPSPSELSNFFRSPMSDDGTRDR
jgi:serine/threonine protein kinase